MTERKRLEFGHGLVNILHTNLDSEKNESINIVLIPLTYIKPSRLQPRKIFLKDHIEELASSIRNQGVLQPIILRKLETNSYEIIAGERRWRAAKIAGLRVIPSIIRVIDEKNAIAISLIENIQRDNLNVIEEAYAYKRLQDEFSLTHDQISSAVGKARPTISNIIRLLNLPEKIQNMILLNELEAGHAKLLVGIESKDQNIFAQEIIKRKLSVRDAEKMITSMRKLKVTDHVTSKVNNPNLNKWMDRLSNTMFGEIKIRPYDNGKYKLVFNVDTSDMVERLINALEKI